MRRGGARGGRAARGGLCAAVLLGVAASVAWASPPRCSRANLLGLYGQIVESCTAPGGLASLGCCMALEPFTASPPAGTGNAGDCFCYPNVFQNLKQFVVAELFPTSDFPIDDIVRGCSVKYGVNVGTPENRCNAEQPEPEPEAEADPVPVPAPVPAPELTSCAGMRKKVCRQTSGGDCFFYRKSCRPTLQRGPTRTIAPCWQGARRPAALLAARSPAARSGVRAQPRPPRPAAASGTLESGAAPTGPARPPLARALDVCF